MKASIDGVVRLIEIFLSPTGVPSHVKVSFTTQWLRPLGSSWSGTVPSAFVDSGVFGGGGGGVGGGGGGGGGGKGEAGGR